MVTEDQTNTLLENFRACQGNMLIPFVRSQAPAYTISAQLADQTETQIVFFWNTT